jgi:hypothetical protein
MIWGGVEFSCENTGEFDGVVILNYPVDDQVVKCNPANILILHQEPGDIISNKFMYQYKDYRVYSHMEEVADVIAQPALGWHVGKTYTELKSMAVEGVAADKARLISGVVSSNVSLLGHYKRLRFKEFLESRLDIDFYGKGYNYIEDKWTGLYPYKFSVAIENTSKKDYWTEKIADCFLAYTYPVYYGCTNIGKYFPKNSFIQIDIEKYEYSLDKIKDVLSSDYYSENFDNLNEARELVLNKYGFAPALSSYVCDSFESATMVPVHIKPYRSSAMNKVTVKLLRNKHVVKWKDR